MVNNRTPTHPPAARPQSHVVITPADVAMGIVALVLAVGLVAASLLERSIPVVLVVAFGQIITFYFGRTARS